MSDFFLDVGGNTHTPLYDGALFTYDNPHVNAFVPITATQFDADLSNGPVNFGHIVSTLVPLLPPDLPQHIA